MSEVTAEAVRELRERSGAGMVDCKKALVASKGNVEEALVELRKKGLATAAKKAGRTASDGVVGSYIHAGGKIGVLVEVNCETDFVARTDDFQNLVKDISLQIAAANPRYVRREDVTPELLETERQIYRAQAATTGKPAPVIEKIVDGKVEKFYAEACLLEQAFIKDPDRTIGQMLTDAVSKMGENIVVRRFARFQLGEQSASAT